MGRLQAEEMLSLLKQEQALQWHLQYNHYPPVSLAFMPVTEEAIERGNQGDWDYVIEMPNGKSLTVAQVIEGLHLDTFLNTQEEE